MNPPEDVRAFYAALAIHLPDRAQLNANVQCFADPQAHAHTDRSPSCSVSLVHGAWRCWACGARGGPYDAAIALGHSPASAIDLLVSHGLAERRVPATPACERRNPPVSRPRATDQPSLRPTLAATEADVTAWQAALFSEQGQRWTRMLMRERLWSVAVMRELELGHHHGRITIPIRDANGGLRGVLRYRPSSPTNKMLAVPGTRLGLVPHPVRERSRRILLAEGPPDMIAARSRGWPAIAVPGDHAWKPAWAQLLEGRTITVVMDSDQPGRAAAKRIAADLRAVATVRIVDLAPDRDDGYDLTNWLLEQLHQRTAPCTASLSQKQTIRH